MNDENSVSVIVITWNQVECLSRCLESICNDFDFNQDEIIVIDNGSEDDSESVIRTRFPDVQYFPLKNNIGVGPARNRGILASSKNFIMTIDNDAYLTTPFPVVKNSIVEAFATVENLGVMGFRLCYPSGQYQFNGRQFPRMLQPLSSRLTLLRKFKYFHKLHTRHMRTELEQSLNGLHEVDYVLGANQIYRRHSLATTSVYDESIFYGPEDIEFCWKHKIAGHRNMVNMSCTISHDYQRRSTKINGLFIRHLISFYRIWLKIRPTRQA